MAAPGTAAARVRPATPADTPALAAINRRARAAVMPWLREARTEAEAAAWPAGVLFARQRVLVAEAGHGPLAYAAFGGAAQQGLTVFDLHIAPERRCRGPGRVLLGVAKKEAGGAVITLRCFARNRAGRAFYEPQGFRAAASGDGADNEEAEPDHTYVWRPGTEEPTRGATA